MMKKIDIYSEMLWRTLSYIRGKQTCSFISKGTDKTCYMEAELLHDVSKYLSNENITSGDIKFLNYNARFYLENADPHKHPNYESHKKNILLLFEMVPHELQSELKWNPKRLE
ncbi:hypothetical protein [Citrobacter portucalensis]|nr:hypothetical protein [Citrobacter portucalensis]MCW8353910.1 hypothetical protein [Citrobacter portucalensis]MCX8995429.1 hypothetical protein [Citrobacter portucalensis]MCX9059240.1 hypothetical protein [Citrobacter portucalensis]MCX9068380.1 hypothetical protein [Citrobacter portucalensis]WNI86969.1 hypothetical protein RIK60_03890 [Citrobacter portucalensis]